MLSDKIKIDIVSGFLGAGKTTFIKSVVTKVYAAESIAVLENEFGEIDFDTDNISQTGLKVESIKGGCICCSGAINLTEGLLAIAEQYQPQRIILEPSGIARIPDLLRIINSPSIAKYCELDNIITIVDARNYEKRLKISKEFCEDQIRFSTTIILSKTEGMDRSAIGEIESELRKINPFGQLYSGSWDSLNANQFSKITERDSDYFSNMFSLANTLKYKFESVSFCYNMQVEYSKISSIMRQIIENEESNIFRIKGDFVDNWDDYYTINYVPGDLQVKLLESTTSKHFRLVVIGTLLNKLQIENTLLNQLKNTINDKEKYKNMG